MFLVNEETGEVAEGEPTEGYREATPADIAAHNAPLLAEERSGGFVDQVRTGVEEAGRRIVSGGAALARGIEQGFAGQAELDGAPPEAIGVPTEVTGADVAPGYFTPAARERREVNPTAAALGGAVPLVAAGVAGPAGLGVAFGLDVADAAAKEATDAEIEGRGISGEHILSNAALNLVFSGAAHAVPFAARSLMRGTENVVQRGARAAVSRLEQTGAQSVAKKVGQTVQRATEAVESYKLPKVASNPGAQREALGELVELAGIEGHATLRDSLDALIDASPRAKFEGLQALRAKAPAGPVADALDAAMSRPELWGKAVVDNASAVQAARSLAPGADASPGAWQAYANALRRLPGKEFEKHADMLDELSGMKALDGIGLESAVTRAAGKAGRFAATAYGQEATEAAFKGAGFAAGLAAGGPLGAGVGWFAGRALNKKFGDRIVSSFAEQAGNVAKAGASATAHSGFVKAAQALKDVAELDNRITARLLVHVDQAEKFARLVGDEAGTVYERFRGEHETPNQAFQAHRSALAEFQRDPAKLIDMLGEQLGNVDELSPALHAKLTAKSLEIAAFLQEKMPKARSISVARPNGTPPSPMQIRQWALFFTAATDPNGVMADARAGRLRREQVTTLQRLWPERYNQLRSDVLEQLGEGRSSTTTRQRMNLLFNFGSGLDPALGPRTRRLAAEARAQQQQSAAQNSTPNRASQSSEASMSPGGMTAMQLTATGG